MTSRTVKRAALVALLVVVGLIVLLLATAHTPWTRKYLVARLREEARAAGLSMEIDSLGYNLPYGSVELEGVTLRRASPSGLPPFLTARRVRVNVSTRSLLFDRAIAVNNGVIDGLAIHIVRDANGQTNLPESSDAKPGSDELPAFLISSLTATGSLTIDDRVTRFDASIPAWKLNLTGNALPLKHYLRFDQTGTGTLRYQGRQQSLDTLSLNANFDRRNATVEHLRVATARSGATISGTMAGFGQPVVDFTTDARLDLRPLLTFAGRPDLAQEVEGIVLAKAKVRDRIASPNVEADITTENVVSPRAGSVKLDANATWEAASGTIELRSGSLRTPDATLGVQGKWTGTTPQSVNRAKVRIERADLLALSRSFNLETKIASAASGNGEAEWRGTEIQAANGTVQLNLTSTQSSSPNVLAVSGTISARGRQGNIHVESSKIQTLGSVMQAKVDLAGQRLSGVIEGNVTNLGTLIPNLAAFLGERGAALRDQKAAGQAKISAKLGGTVNRPTADLTLNGSGIQYGPLEDVQLDVDAAYDPAQFTVTQARAAWKGSEIAASGRIGLEGAQRTLSFDGRTNAVDIGDLLGALGRPMPVDGIVNATASGTGTVDNPHVQLNVQGSGLTAYGEQLGQLTSQASYANHTLDVKSLHLEKPEKSGTLDAKGTLQTKTRDYTVQMQANAFAVRNLVIEGGQPLRGVVDLSAAGQGNLDSPALTLDLGVKEAEGAGRKLGTIQTNVKLANNEAVFTAAAPSFNVKADGKAQLKAPYPVTLHANLQDTDLAKLPLGNSATPPVTGVITAEVRASGEAENWRKGEADVTVASLRLDTPAGPVTNHGPIEASYRNQTLEVTAARLNGPKFTLSLEGRLPLEATAQPGTLRYNGAFDLTALEPWIAQRSGVTVAGQATVQGSLTGTLERMEPAAQLTLTNGSMRGQSLRNPVENIQLDAALENGSVNVRKLEASAASGRLTANGTVPLALFPIPARIVTTGASGPAKFTLQATGFQIESLLKVPETVHSDIALNVEMAADKPELNAIQATATFTSLNLDLAGIKLAPDAPPRIALRNGVASIENFSLQGDGAHLQAAGSLDVNSKELRAVNLTGNFDAALLTSFSEDAAATGPISFEMAAKGTLNDPQMTGFLEWTDGQAGLMSPPVQASDLNVRIGLANNQVRIERFQGELNGGTLTAAGSFRIANGTIQDPALETTAENVYLDFPEGLQTRSTVRIRLVPQRELYVLDGTVRIDEGSYTRPLDLQTELLQYVRNRGGVELIGQRNEFLSRLRYNIAIQAREPIVMDNNLGELALTADLRLLGTYYRPGLAGRIQLEEGGTLKLQENKYTIEQGTISFVNEARIEPWLDLTARTEVANREIGMRIYTERDGIQTDLTSDNPDDTRADILALLLTGRTAEKLEGRELSIVGEQAGMALLAGSLTGRVSEQLTNTLGLTSVRIEPSLISAEKNPTARLTIGQDLATGLEFIYSMDLTNSSDQIYVVDYDVTRRFNARGTRQDDNTYRFDFQHDLRFGGLHSSAPKRYRREERPVGTVKFTGELVFPESTLADKFGIKAGKRYNFFKMREGLDSLQAHYKKNNYLEAKIRARQQQSESEVNLHVHVEAGPTVEFAYENWDPPGRLRDAVRDLWNRGVFDTQRRAKSIKAIRGTLAKQGYLRPEIMTSVRIPDMGRKTVTFEVVPGRMYDDVDLVFTGAEMIEASTIESQIKRAKLKDRIATDPDDVGDFITRYYQQEGFLDAKVTGPEYDLNEQTDRGVIRFVIQEGALYKFGAVNFHGAETIPPKELEAVGNIRKGSFYSPKVVDDSRNTIEEAYWARGYRDVVLDYRLEKRPAQAEVDLNVTVQENQKSVVQEIQVAGNDVTSASFVRKQIVLKQGEPLDYRRTARSRRLLYDTGAFASVDLREETITPAEVSDKLKHVRLIADVRERTPFQFRYGAFYDTERGPGVIADFSNRNSLGGGRLIGVRTRYDSDVRETRLYFSQPLLRQLPLRTDTAAFRRRELREAFITDRTGVTLQQLLRLRDRFELTYGYRFERAHTFDRVLIPDDPFPFDESLRIAPLTATLSRDTRNEVLDATRGSFTSHAFEFSTATLGSHLRFMKYFGQYFKYFGLSEPAPVPFKGALELPRVIFATGVRVGLAHGLGGQEVIRSERFFAGGGTTVRGFQQDKLGPVDFLGQPDGGNALLVFNNELRFPLFWWFEGVTFVDVGNVYPTIRDFRFGDLRTTGGPGLRLRTPYFLLRADYGVKFSQRPGESRGSWFFSIGQAF